MGLAVSPRRKGASNFSWAKLDIVDVGVALTEDNTQLVQSWIEDGWIRHPVAEELSDWNANKEKEFISLVVPPFVLVRLDHELLIEQ